MIRIERSEAFWRPIIEHPQVRDHLDLGTGFDWLPSALTDPNVIPLATDHGGYFFHRIDPLGRVLELHAAFAPSGWGGVANTALRASLAFLGGFQVITSTEVDGNWRSRPPRSFGFRPAGPMTGGFRTWVLTRAAWEQSPARRRTE